MVLCKHSRLQVGKIERSRSGEINLLQKMAAGIVDQNRPSVKWPTSAVARAPIQT